MTSPASGDDFGNISSSGESAARKVISPGLCLRWQASPHLTEAAPHDSAQPRLPCETVLHADLRTLWTTPLRMAFRNDKLVWALLAVDTIIMKKGPFHLVSQKKRRHGAPVAAKQQGLERMLWGCGPTTCCSVELTDTASPVAPSAPHTEGLQITLEDQKYGVTSADTYLVQLMSWPMWEFQKDSEFCRLSQTYTSHEDKLQVKNVIYRAAILKASKSNQHHSECFYKMVVTQSPDSFRKRKTPRGIARAAAYITCAWPFSLPPTRS
ncbi:hypothetical protein GH733_008580 [Mirounga leonina]|nr:hypothetical protein GH733_008580 [Mirounga leonina]